MPFLTPNTPVTGLNIESTVKIMHCISTIDLKVISILNQKLQENTIYFPQPCIYQGRSIKTRIARTHRPAESDLVPLDNCPQALMWKTCSCHSDTMPPDAQTCHHHQVHLTRCPWTTAPASTTQPVTTASMIQHIQTSCRDTTLQKAWTCHLNQVHLTRYPWKTRPIKMWRQSNRHQIQEKEESPGKEI